METQAPGVLNTPLRIIAEAGVNHNGNPELALRLIEAAAEAGADMIKFQAFSAAALVSATAPKAAYQQRTTSAAESQLEMIRRLEFAPDIFFQLAAHCIRCGIGFLCSPFDQDAVRLLANMGLNIMKIPSGEITNPPYLRAVGSLGKELILSTGMCNLGEVENALHLLEEAGTPLERITLLHCTTEYPAPYAEVNLCALHTLRTAFPRCAGVGYSDHTQGLEIPFAATALGACVIEKHFTLDRNLEGPDHQASLEPPELAALVRGVHNVQAALGNGEKRPTPSELPNRIVARKSIVAARDIAAGTLLTEENLTTKRPGNGISALHWDEVLHTRAPRNLRKDELL